MPINSLKELSIKHEIILACHSVKHFIVLDKIFIKTEKSCKDKH